MKSKLLFLTSLVLLSCPVIAQKGRQQVREGNELYQKEKFDQALGKYREGLAEAPDSPIIRFNLGDALYKGGEFDQATRSYEDALSADDARLRGQAYYNLGNTLFRQNQLPESLEAYKNALRLNPDDQDAKHNLEWIQRMLEQDPQQSPQKQDNDQNKDNEEDKDGEQQQQKQEEDERQQGDSQEDQPEEQKDNQQQQPDESEEKPQDEQAQPEDPQAQDQQEQQQSQPQPAGMSKEQAEQLLKALADDPAALQKKKMSKIKRRARAKDW